MRGTYNPMTDELPGVFGFGLRDPTAQAARLSHALPRFLMLTVVEKSDAQGNPALYSKAR